MIPDSYMPIGGKQWPASAAVASDGTDGSPRPSKMSHRLSEGDTAMGYGHAERNLALIRQLEAETRDLLETLDQPDPGQSAWLQKVTSAERQTLHQRRPETVTACSVM